MTHLVMERTFERPLTDDDLKVMMQRLGPCMMQQSVRWLHSYLSNDRRRMICTFEAADAEAVRMAYRTAGYPFERVWPAEKLTMEHVEALMAA